MKKGHTPNSDEAYPQSVEANGAEEAEEAIDTTPRDAQSILQQARDRLVAAMWDVPPERRWRLVAKIREIDGDAKVYGFRLRRRVK